MIRGENVMKGYWNRPEATAEAMRDGWFHTGDLATRDDDGFYFIVDRKKDMIIRNGFNVYPREVEEVLYTHPAVAEAAVFGVPDALHGEEIAALVTLKDGRRGTEDEIRDFVKEQIAAYKYPRIIRFGALPKGPTGKILKREIKIDLRPPARVPARRRRRRAASSRSGSRLSGAAPSPRCAERARPTPSARDGLCPPSSTLSTGDRRGRPAPRASRKLTTSDHCRRARPAASPPRRRRWRCRDRTAGR